MDALQQEIESLQNEKKDLKDKMRQLTKKNLLDCMNRTPNDSMRSIFEIVFIFYKLM